MNKKLQVNIVYMPGEGPPSIIYENDKAVVWNSNKYDPAKKNVGMGWYSIPKPKHGDSLLAIEPYCILPRDYETGFAKRFTNIFTWTPGAFEEKRLKRKLVQIKHPCWHSNPNIDELSKNWLPWGERKNEVVFIANNKTASHDSELYSLRIHLANLLHKESNYDVSWYGQIELKKPYYKGPIDSKQDVLTKAKFSVCMENSYDPIYTQNYFSEKMPEVWRAGCVPIYMGCYNIDEFEFDDQSYIDLRLYVSKNKKIHNVNYSSLFARMDGFDKDRYRNWSVDVKNNIFKSGKLFDLVGYKDLYETIINRLVEVG